MQTLIEPVLFGTIDKGEISTIYNAPSILSKEVMKKISFQENIYNTTFQEMVITEENINEDTEVTHEVFFGENIKRVFNTLFK